LIHNPAGRQWNITRSCCRRQSTHDIPPRVFLVLAWLQEVQ
jgi:hypothetical protein